MRCQRLLVRLRAPSARSSVSPSFPSAGGRGSCLRRPRSAVLSVPGAGALGEGRAALPLLPRALLLPPAPTLQRRALAGPVPAACCAGRGPRGAVAGSPTQRRSSSCPGLEVSRQPGFLLTLRGRLAGSQPALENIQSIPDFIQTQALVVGGGARAPGPRTTGPAWGPHAGAVGPTEVPPGSDRQDPHETLGLCRPSRFWGNGEHVGLMLRGPHTSAHPRPGPGSCARLRGEPFLPRQSR